MTRNTAGIVTGGGSGIGAATVEFLIESGAGVLVVDRDRAALRALRERLQTDRLAILAGDVTDPEFIDQMVSECGARLGGLDFLVNAAGVGGQRALIEETDIADYDQVLNVNLKGAYLAMRAVIAHMRDAGASGSIVNISSLAGIKAVASSSAYSASKFGVIGLTKAAALETAAAGIRVNAILPGLIDTPMARAAFEGRDNPFIDAIPMKRIGMAVDVAKGILWLLGPDSTYVTGVTLSIDGGLSAL